MLHNEVTVNNAFNVCVISIGKANCRATIAVVYRAPWANKNDTKNLLSYLSSLAPKSKRFIVVGDFNLPQINWFDSSDTAQDGMSNALQMFAQYECLKQIIDKLTRENFILDIALLSTCSESANVKILTPVASSDHNAIIISLPESSFINCSAVCRTPNYNNFSNADFGIAASLLYYIDWNVLFHKCIDVDDYVSVFTEVLTSALRQSISSRCSRFNHPLPLPKHILRIIAKKKRAWITAKQSGTSDDFKRYKQLCKSVRSAIRNYHKEREIQLVREGNFVKFFTYTNNQLGKNKSNDIALLMKEELVTDSLQVAEIFNAQFAEYFSSVSKECIVNTDGLGHIDGLQLNCDQRDVIKYLLSASDSAPGHDLIPGAALRKLAHVIARPITIIFQQSLFQSKFPTAWKRAIIQPVYKRKGDKNSPLSYRPISLCCTMGKLLEKIVNDQLLSHINSVGLISDRQHGFTKNRSAVTNLLAADSILSK